MGPTKAPTKSPTAAPTKAPTVAAPTEAPTPTPPTSSPAYFLADKSVGGTCPSGSEDVPESDCLAAAHEAGEGLNLPTWLNKFDWAGLPCRCFLWHNTNGSILVDYNTATTSCNPNAHTQMVCKSSAPPTPPSPTLKPTLAPTKSPTAAPTKVPTVAAPTEAPTPTPPTSSPAYFLADK